MSSASGGLLAEMVLKAATASVVSGQVWAGGVPSVRPTSWRPRPNRALMQCCVVCSTCSRQGSSGETGFLISLCPLMSPWSCLSRSFGKRAMLRLLSGWRCMPRLSAVHSDSSLPGPRRRRASRPTWSARSWSSMP